MRKEAAKRVGDPSELPALAQSVTVGFKDVFSKLPLDVQFSRCFGGFFLPLPPISESSTGLENALKHCSHTCFSVLALRQGNVCGKTLGKDSPGSRSSVGMVGAARAGAAHQHWEQLSWRDGKTHGNAKLENGRQNIIPLCFPCPTECCSFLWISSHSWQHGESVGGIHVGL